MAHWLPLFDGGKILVKDGTLALFNTSTTSAQCCCPRCRGCAFPTNVLGQVQVTLSGFGGTFSGGGGGPCTTAFCADYLNQTFILDRFDADDGDDCYWRYDFNSGSDPCVNVPDFLDFTTRIISGHYWAFVTVSTSFPQTGLASWALDLGTTAPDCSAFDELSVPFSVESYTCTHDGSPALVTAL